MSVSEVASLVRGLQERTAHAFPAVVLQRLDGWLLRYTDSGAWWASSVLPHSDGLPTDLPTTLQVVEDFYANHGARARFQICPAAAPAGLDDALAAHGYRLDSAMSLRTALTDDVVANLSAGPLEVHVDDRPTEAWFAVWLAIHGTTADPDRAWELLHRVNRRSAYASVVTSVGVVAAGRAVSDTGWAGVFGMATLPKARGQGAATAVLAALGRWAAESGAPHMYLQVEPDNTTARGLYDRAGFTELCGYHYRVLPVLNRAANAAVPIR